MQVANEYKYGFFGRHGGRGTEPFDTLNISYGVGDEKNIVLANREYIKNQMGVKVLLSGKQVHGDQIYVQREPLTCDQEIDDVDALITNQAGIGLMIQQADCQAILLFAREKNVIAAIHCGWRGSVGMLLPKVVEKMVNDFRVEPTEVQAILSPSLGPCCAEFVNYKKELPLEFEPFMVGDAHFDFWEISKHQLVKAGLNEQNIHTDVTCTRCSRDYFSYRRATKNSAGITGRNCSVIVLNND